MKKKILGTVQLGMPYGINNGVMPTRAYSLKLLEYAYDQGIRYIDTARAYGEALEVVGDYHQKNPDKKFQVFSKFMLSDLNNNINNLITSQCQILKIENLTGLYYHRFQEYKVSRNLIKECTYKNLIGVSVYSLDEFIEVNKDPLVNIIQISMSVFHHHSKIKMHFNEINSSKQVYVRSVYLQGLLFSPYEKLIGPLTEFVPLRKFIDKLASQLNISKEKLAASYVMDLKNVSGVLFGAETVNQVEESNKILNSSSYDWEELLKDMPRLVDESLLNPGNWK